MFDLDREIKELKAIFSKNNYRDAHQFAANNLNRMAADNQCLYEIVKRNLMRDGFFAQNRINPVIAFKVEENQHFSLVAHAFMPHPERITDLSHQSIHHHGNLLLSTINAFGPGYDSMLFKEGFSVEGEIAKLELDKAFHHGPKALEFIPGNCPHIVFFPPDVTITYALWSSTERLKTDALKKLSILKPVKNQLKKLIHSAGLSKALNINQIQYVDFYVENEKFICLKDRVRYEEASNENFIQNFFYLLNSISFPDKELVRDIVGKLPEGLKAKVDYFANQFINGEEIKDSLEAIHLNINHVHLRRKDIEAALK